MPSFIRHLISTDLLNVLQSVTVIVAQFNECPIQCSCCFLLWLCLLYDCIVDCRVSSFVMIVNL
jgi:hypothetical protein